MLKALLNIPQPSGKLARWGMALQELDLQIKYRSGKTNARADTLSHYPVSLLQEDVSQTLAHPLVTAAVDKPPAANVAGKKSNEDSLSHDQCQDLQLADTIQYIETSELPKEEKRAQKALTSTAFTGLDNVPYLMESDSTLRIVPHTSDHHKLF